MLARIRTYLRRRKYRPGAQLMRLVACDIRRDVEIVDASEVDDGYVTARVRTRNLLYQINLGAPIPELRARDRRVS